jgi:hypothetical protein
VVDVRAAAAGENFALHNEPSGGTRDDEISYVFVFKR